MTHLLVIVAGIAEPIRRVAAMLALILRAVRPKVESNQDRWHCDGYFCGDVYLVETDAFGDGCMTYYVGFLTGHHESE